MRAALVLGARVREQANVLQAPRQRVALALQLREAQQSRTTGVEPVDARHLCRDVRERRGDDPRKLALQARDLQAQRASRGALVERLRWRCHTIDRRLLERSHSDSS
jgi:hypothetical protein